MNNPFMPGPSPSIITCYSSNRTEFLIIFVLSPIMSARNVGDTFLDESGKLSENFLAVHRTTPKEK